MSTQCPKVAVENIGQFHARSLQMHVGTRTDAMWTGRVADKLVARFEPCLARFRQKRGRRVMVEVKHAKP
jgi:hypothetical protein